MLEMFASHQRERDMLSVVLEKRLDSMNEFRESLKDQANLMLTRNEHEIYIQKVDSDIRILRESRAELAGKASQASVNITFLVALIGSLSGLVTLFLRIVKGS